MTRFPLFLSLFAVVAVPAAASTYSAKLTVPTTQRIIGREIVWACGADACQGATDEGRPVVLCESLARRAGKVDLFLVDGRALAAAELDRCNAVAKPAAEAALAAH